MNGLCVGLVRPYGLTINGRALRPQFLLDFGLALLFVIVFQYLNIAQ